MTSTLRKRNLERLRDETFDVLVVGGGINGAACAAALSARGLSVALIEGDDFAGGASSHSSNLIWGGIKYLESHEYLLVERLCRSRNCLLRAYPASVREVRFLTAIRRGFRFPPLLVYLGSLVYWVMGRFATRAPRYCSPARLKRREALIDTADMAGGLEYSDCYLPDNDARFVFGFIRKALDYGCAAANYARCEALARRGEHWQAQVLDTPGAQRFTVRARALVNACGPWAERLNAMAGIETTCRHVFSKGVHLIVERLVEVERVLAFFASDGRLFFLIPMGPGTCIGTTDTRVDTPDTSVTDADREFILDNVNAVLDLQRPLARGDIIAERCAVRPLAVRGADTGRDWLELSRRHVLEVDNEHRCLSIFGGKLTDCLNVGEEVSRALEGMGLQVSAPEVRWYGEPPAALREQYMLQAALMNLDELTDAGSSEPLSQRFWRRYGERAFWLLERIREDAGEAGLLIEGAEYTRCEIELAARQEMVVKLQDFMRRRSKIEQVVPAQVIADAPGLREACRILFADEAQQRYREYLDLLLHTSGDGGGDPA